MYIGDKQIGSEDCGTHPPAIEIRALQPNEDAEAFRTLNEEWITQYFVLEKKDREILDDPEKTILRQGGHIFMVYVDRHAGGCVALVPLGHGVYELSQNGGLASAPWSWDWSQIAGTCDHTGQGDRGQVLIPG